MVSGVISVSWTVGCETLLLCSGTPGVASGSKARIVLHLALSQRPGA